MGIKKTARKANKMVKFISDEAEEKYNNKVSGQKFHEEKGFKYSNAEHHGLPAEIDEIIERRGWRSFCRHPGNPITPLVKEFYSSFLKVDQEEVTVRGTSLPLNHEGINRMLGLPKVKDEYGVVMKNLSEEFFNEVLRELTVEGTEQTKDQSKD